LKKREEINANLVTDESKLETRFMAESLKEFEQRIFSSLLILSFVERKWKYFE